MTYSQRFKSIDQRWREKFTRPRGKDSCWLWKTGADDQYPNFWDGSDYVKASHFAYKRSIGPIPKGRHVLHSCDNPRCVRPSHLFLGTHTDNMRDRCDKRRNNAPVGEKNGRAILTQTQADEIRRLYAIGDVSQTALAARFKISQQVVSGIIRNIYWVTP